MDFRHIPEVSLSLCAITGRDLRIVGRRGPGRVRGRRGLPGAEPRSPPSCRPRTNPLTPGRSAFILIAAAARHMSQGTDVI